MHKASPSTLSRLAVGALVLGLGACAAVPMAEIGPYPDDDAPAVDWLSAIEARVPPMRNARGGRFPLILWNGVGFDPLPPETVRMMLDRGLVQHVRLDPAMVPTARALADAGAPVIVMDAKGDVWPYDLAGDEADWSHDFPADAENVKPEWRGRPSPTVIAGWAVAADQVRATMAAFRDAGVTVDAVWLDNEGEPRTAGFEAAKASAKTRNLLPPKALSSPGHFFGFKRRLWIELMAAYFAAPVREAFPKASVTNWLAVVSTPERPILNWQGRPFPPTDPGLFTATNPVAYGIDMAFLNEWRRGTALNRDMVDRFYTNLLLRQVSDDAANRARIAPWLQSVPWVARYVSIIKVEAGKTPPQIPMMSRETYREVLRHLWLRGIDGMQVFNAPGVSSPEIAIEEIEDAAAVYDEMLAHARFLEGGEVMNTAYLGPRAPGAVWSGLRLENEALIRAFAQGPFDAPFTVSPWPGCTLDLTATAKARTWLIRRNSGRCATVGP